jgi:SAM-dependent methyltransferase
MSSNIPKFEMSRYIDLEAYHAVERSHPYYKEMIAEICSIVRGFGNDRAGNGPVKVLELGAGTGLLTEDLLKIPFAHVTALEYDSNCCKFLIRLEQDGRCVAVQGDAVVYKKEGNFDIVCSSFAHDHIHYEKAKEFAKNIRANLRKGGIYIMGGEILPYYSTKEERIESLYTYHCMIVNQALREGHFRLAQLEIDALESGIHMTGDFKRHEALFEEEMLSTSFRMVKKAKMGPTQKNVGGVYVYGFEAI